MPFQIANAGTAGYSAKGPNVKVLSQVVDLTNSDFSTLASTDTIEVLSVPAGTVVLSAGYEILTVGTGSGTLSLGDGADPDRYVAAVVQTGAGQKAALATNVPHLYTAADTIDLLSATAVCNSKVNVWAVICDCNNVEDNMLVTYNDNT
jgi:hypothetical protein